MPSGSRKSSKPEKPSAVRKLKDLFRGDENSGTASSRQEENSTDLRSTTEVVRGRGNYNTRGNTSIRGHVRGHVREHRASSGREPSDRRMIEDGRPHSATRSPMVNQTRSREGGGESSQTYSVAPRIQNVGKEGNQAYTNRRGEPAGQSDESNTSKYTTFTERGNRTLTSVLDDETSQAGSSDLEDKCYQPQPFHSEHESGHAAQLELNVNNDQKVQSVMRAVDVQDMSLFWQKSQEIFYRAHGILEEQHPERPHEWGNLVLVEDEKEHDAIFRLDEILRKIWLLFQGCHRLTYANQQLYTETVTLKIAHEASLMDMREDKASHAAEMATQLEEKLQLEKVLADASEKELKLKEQLYADKSLYDEAIQRLENEFQNERDKMRVEQFEEITMCEGRVDRAEKEHQKQVCDIERTHLTEITKHKKAFSEKFKECTDAQATVATMKRDYERQMRNLEDESRRKHDQDLEMLSEKYSQEKGNMSTAFENQRTEAGMKIARLQYDILELGKKTRQEQREMGKEAQETQANMKRDHIKEQERFKTQTETTIQSMKQEAKKQKEHWQSELAEYKQKYEQEQQIIREQAQQFQANMKKTHVEEQQRLRAHAETVQKSLEGKMEEERKQMQFTLGELEREHGQEKQDMKAAHSMEVKQLKSGADKAQVSMKRDIRSRNNALVAREKFKGLPDGELKNKFTELVLQVDALARLRWSYNRSKWTDGLQSKLSDTPKRLRKQILQDTIWGILFENVFCSPFRMIGDEGKRLEAQWAKDFGADTATKNDGYAWPEPSYDAERWRYEALRQCQEALEKPISEYDPRYKLRKGTLQSLDHVRQEISQALSNVSSVDAATIRSVQSIAEKAVKMWVILGAQRCRLVVVSRGSKVITETSKAHSGGDGFVELVVRPELKRIGDADGVLFDSETTITGCVGEIIKILY
ncbi:hypothetical protein CC86DRAFT_457643 [Ophiobolus disseminans]|uniref:Uncharacterized protein n=1 Tax=Ophiobolus disseminans TaxID=1469910 RepID=A0A6A6ZSA3_9PLEO|nr:hypothetical protein CC86DRAFT_457643 [Ophiobolus disseminans]